MKLYLVQHGDSKPEEVDPSRGLTEKGASDVGKIAAFLKSQEVPMTTVWHSGKARARETAKILGAAIAVQSLQMHDGLAPKDPVNPVREELAQLRSDLMIVGHLPFLGKLASVLVAGSESADAVAFRQGGIVCLERDDQGVWRVRWMVTPDLFR